MPLLLILVLIGLQISCANFYNAYVFENSRLDCNRSSSLPIPMLAVCCETNASAAHIYPPPPPPQLVKDKSKIQVHSSQDCFLISFWKQQSQNFFAIILESKVISSRFHRDVCL